MPIRPKASPLMPEQLLLPIPEVRRAAIKVVRPPAAKVESHVWLASAPGLGGAWVEGMTERDAQELALELFSVFEPDLTLAKVTVRYMCPRSDWKDPEE